MIDYAVVNNCIDNQLLTLVFLKKLVFDILNTYQDSEGHRASKKENQNVYNLWAVGKYLLQKDLISCLNEPNKEDNNKNEIEKEITNKFTTKIILDIIFSLDHRRAYKIYQYTCNKLELPLMSPKNFGYLFNKVKEQKEKAFRILSLSSTTTKKKRKVFVIQVIKSDILTLKFFLAQNFVEAQTYLVELVKLIRKIRNLDDDKRIEPQNTLCAPLH